MDIDILSFMPALLPVALSPGASFTLVMSSALSGGRSGLLRTLAGTAVGIYSHALLIGLGITAIIISLPGVYNVLEVVGTIYLLWLGFMLIRRGIKSKPDNVVSSPHSITAVDAFITNILNPKAIIFYLTVVSRFAGQQGGVGSYLILASVHVVVMSLWLVIVSHILIFSAKSSNPVLLKKYVNISGGLLLCIFSLCSIFK
ncbi:LysE family translocator [Xenorhabdus bovienii]|uniref:LysE family translocator n=1 Tax=Xenorhabdus bovienii TaxID=40576 RepID=UPI0023B342F8|nr:LysE family translocator [Xenorhabdus bovienii]MDE9447132.1 LysE family translocator [Xenorhabdus bovienii]MDE9536420.1 LysE family translocator [Xenorhabdus bovienii]MDE9589843.1 LysE family translocator [Xenorhabdus bovienii]